MAEEQTGAIVDLRVFYTLEHLLADIMSGSSDERQLAYTCLQRMADACPYNIFRQLVNSAVSIARGKVQNSRPEFPPIRELIYFDHPTEGRLRLQWENPLPREGSAGYICDVCKTQKLKCSFQHIDGEGNRDTSTFRLNTWGWDVCCKCALILWWREACHFYMCAQRLIDANSLPPFPSITTPDHLPKSPVTAKFSATRRAILSLHPSRRSTTTDPSDGIVITMAVDPENEDSSVVSIARRGVTQELFRTSNRTASIASASLHFEPDEMEASDSGSDAEPSWTILNIGDEPAREITVNLHAGGGGVPFTSAGMHRSEAYARYEIKLERVHLYNGELIVNASASSVGEFLFCVCTDSPLPPDSNGWVKLGAMKHLGHRSQRIAILTEDDEEALCVICQENILSTSGTRIRPLTAECGHVFHEGCLRKMLRGLNGTRNNQSCPVCRSPNPLGTVEGSLASLAPPTQLQYDMEPCEFKLTAACTPGTGIMQCLKEVNEAGIERCKKLGSSDVGEEADANEYTAGCQSSCDSISISNAIGERRQLYLHCAISADELYPYESYSVYTEAMLLL